MSVYLEAVRQAREDRDNSEHDYRAAITRAAQHHSLREVGRAAGITHAGVRYIINQQNGGRDANS